MLQDAVTATLVVFGALGMLGSIAFSKYYISNRYRFIFVVTFGTTLSLILMQVAAYSMFTMILVCIFCERLQRALRLFPNMRCRECQLSTSQSADSL